MRLFLSLAIPDNVKTHLVEVIQRLKPIASEVTWCTRDQLHVTLAYLGEISPAILPHVTTACSRVGAVCDSFTCRAYGFGFFGTKRNPKILWAGIDPNLSLLTLQETLWKELDKYGFKNEESLFRPHIMLGRCLNKARNHPLIEEMDLSEEVAFGSWQATAITLFECRLTPKGEHYRRLAQTPLGM